MTDPFAPPTGPPVSLPPASPAPPLYGAPLYGEPLRPVGSSRNGLGTAGLVLGVLALLGSFAVLPGLLLGPAAVVLGLLGRGRTRRGEATNGGRAAVGAVTGGLGVLISAGIVVWFLTSAPGQEYVRCLSAAPDKAAQQTCAAVLDDALFGR